MASILALSVVGIFPFVIAAICAALVALGSETETQSETGTAVAASYQPMVILTHATHA
jgi:hypothetical protein